MLDTETSLFPDIFTSLLFISSYNTQPCNVLTAVAKCPIAPVVNGGSKIITPHTEKLLSCIFITPGMLLMTVCRSWGTYTNENLHHNIN